jgi:hypothetical protein
VREVAPPTGADPPRSAKLPDGEQLDLEELAREVCRRYYEEFADEDERYGEAGRAWCVHDNQWLLSWAALDLAGLDDIVGQVRWLAGVLAARDFPVERLARDLELAAEAVPQLAEPLRAAASELRSSPGQGIGAEP